MFRAIKSISIVARHNSAYLHAFQIFHSLKIVQIPKFYTLNTSCNINNRGNSFKWYSHEGQL